MANPRQFDLEDIVNRPGTYFNPQTEVLIVVDDSPDVDTEVTGAGETLDVWSTSGTGESGASEPSAGGGRRAMPLIGVSVAVSPTQ